MPTIKKDVIKVMLATVILTSSIVANAANVAIVQGSFYTPDLKNQLISSGNTVTEITSYTAASLAGFDSVITYGNTYNNFAELETYAMGGGTVIETPWFWYNYSPTPALDIFSHGGGVVYTASNPGVNILDAGNSILSGVTFPLAGTTNIGRTTGNTFLAGVTQIANWSDGTAFIGEKSLGLGKVIGINMHVITSDTAYTVINQAWAAQLFSNAANTGAAVVPVPAAAWLLGSGLIGLAGIARKRKVA